ncbi:nucleotidyl transferase AbiEii/AbiGii toxin family protein [Sphingopyxis flava]|uniref:nucleotidyl transferase AbiEii/AbiGii toxin family protein n=1 Tax=Sphingopyxis flava TaxID=1507287 RepID=UPI003CCBB4E2
MLYRLGESQHANRFVLKGAMLLMTWLEEPPRLTRERDLQPGDRFDQGLLQSRR